MSHPDLFYNLLPRYNRRQDMAQGSPLRALFDILQAPYDAVEGDIGALYDDWFVESCAPWVLPYIADLIGGTGFDLQDQPGLDARRLVADAVAYRRRKGLAATLEHVIEDATGWTAAVVENMPRTAQTWNLRKAESHPGRLPSIREMTVAPEPFAGLTRLPSLRPGEGMLPVQLRAFVWRREVQPLRGVEAFVEKRHLDRRMLHPLGLPIRLYQRRLRRPHLDEVCNADAAPLPLAQAPRPMRSLSLRFADEDKPLTADAVILADLREWSPPPEWDEARIAVDPDSGRVLLLDPADSFRILLADYSYGGGDMGGGAYLRPSPELPSALPSLQRFPVTTPALFATKLRDLPDEGGIVEISDSRTYGNGDPHEGWNIDLGQDAPRTILIQAAQGERPCLRGGLRVSAGPGGGVLVLDGLLMEGGIHLSGPVTLVLNHCSLFARKRSGAALTSDVGSGVSISATASICGMIALADGRARLHLADSIIDGLGHGAVWNRGGLDVLVERCTLNGAVTAQSLRAENAIFTAPLKLSQAPAALHCCFLGGRAATAVKRAGDPVFVSETLGHPGYFQLSELCPETIRQGASDGGEMGAFHGAATLRRLRNLERAIAQYLPYGLDREVIFPSWSD